ncbi:MAG TPA: hypothetical protein DCM73_13155 [Clostridiales bacterium]|nr:hypothetical protein [Clostridiales bacterium]
MKLHFLIICAIILTKSIIKLIIFKRYCKGEVFMSQAKRGSGIKSNENWRGTCPVCKRTGVKLLWSKVEDEKNTINVCKRCAK